MGKEITKDEFLRKRAIRQRKIRRRRLTAFFIIFIVLLLAAAAALSLTIFFPIETITASGSAIYSPQEIIENSGIKEGDNLFTVSRTDTQNRLRENLPYIESVTLKRKIPSELEIIVEDTEEFAVYATGDKYFTVSESGWVLEENSEMPENLLLIAAKGVSCKVGNEIGFSDESQKAIIQSVIDSIDAENVSMDSVDTTNLMSLKIRVENRFDVNLGSDSHIVEKIRHLAAMIKEIPEEKSGSIDLSMWTNDNTQATFKEKSIE